MIALTREISPAIGDCQLTHLARAPIDVDLARRQHAAYEACLASVGCQVTRIEAGEAMPDSVFIEDTAVVFDEVAVITRPGAESRRGETAAVAQALRPFRSLVDIAPPGTMDGGDVLVAGHHVFVGLSTRTNPVAAAQLAAVLTPFGYRVDTIAVRECLHLKSAVTAIADEVLLLNRRWIDDGRLAGFELVDVDPLEPWGANALRIADSLVVAAAFPRTAARLEARGYPVRRVEVSELAKAEGAVTCCSLVVT